MAAAAANAEQTTAADAQTRIALVIGNANYQDADTPLKDPVGDARALGSALELAGFDVDVAEDLTKDAMRRTLDQFYDKVKPGTVDADLLQRIRHSVQSAKLSDPDRRAHLD